MIVSSGMSGGSYDTVRVMLADDHTLLVEAFSENSWSKT